ncbi:MAG TPA: cyclic nucleotide-binding domain-containing protein, partial [Acidimicrobiales bacterium]|nr:cyclic nucleotide-binding domain-containing protein [Acidimicrobiales bacterium]
MVQNDGTATGTRRWRRHPDGAVGGLRRLAEPLRILLGNRSLTWLLAAFAGVTIAEWGYVTALAVDAFRLHGAIAVGLVGFRLFFAALGSLFAIPYVERHPGGKLLTAIAGTRAVIVATSALLAGEGAPLAVLLVLVAFDAVVSAPYRPAQSAMLPVLARTPNELAASAAGLSTVKTLSQALGAVMGGLLLVVTTPATVFIGVAGVLAAAAAATRRFTRTPALIVGADTPGIRALARDTSAVIRRSHVGGILVVSGLRTFVRGMWIAIAVIASIRLLHAGSAGVGLLMLAAGVGSLAAVPLSATLIGRSRIGTPAALALLTCGIPLGLMAGIPVLGVALVLVAAWGIGMAVADVATLSLLYRLLSTPLLPRVTAAIESAKLALEGLGALLAPILVLTIGVRGALLVAAVPLPLVVAAGWNTLHRVDADAGDRSRTLGLLHDAPCLQALDMATLESLAGRVMHLTVPAATDVVHQGDHGDRFYVVESGTADVLVDGFRVGEVGAGGSFGEKALLRDVARTATVRSRQPMRLLALGREDFLGALTGREEAGAADDVRTRSSSSVWSRGERMELLSRVSLLSHLDSAALGDLADHSVVDRWPDGSTIVRQGSHGDRFFVLLEGRAVVSVGADAVG